MRRSDIEPTSQSAMEMMSAAKATGWAWKLPPEMAMSSSGNRIGLSVTAAGLDGQRARGILQQVE